MMQRLLNHYLPRAVLLCLGVALALPLLSLVFSLFGWDASSTEVLAEMAETVLPRYVWTSLWLCLMVAVGVAMLGVTSAVLVTMFDFVGKRWLEWMLLLPLAMPAYVLAFAYTDALQYSGVVQESLRGWFGLEGRLLPDIRSTWGAALVFTLALYPYVYLIVRSTLLERSGAYLDAARMLGAGRVRRLWRVALPLARPAIAAGMALALMEVLADYGVVSYFGIQSLTAGIYKAWLTLDNRVAAFQLSLVLLVFVAFLLWWEQRAQRKMRFAGVGQSGKTTQHQHTMQLRGWGQVLAWLMGLLPVLLGFVLPVLHMLWPWVDAAWQGEVYADVRWEQFAAWTWHSVKLAGITAVLAVALATVLLAAKRLWKSRWVARLCAAVGLGYAAPGAVVVVGLLLPLATIQSWFPEWGVVALMTTTITGVVWAYLVRFVSIAMQSVQSGYARLPTAYDETAQVLGQGQWRLLRDVHWPLLRGPMAVAGLLVFVDTMKELPATLVLRPFNHDTLAVVAYQLAMDERLPEAVVPALALVLAGLVPVMLLSWTMRPKDNPSQPTA